jgi:GNAT superfamily N-acetyltransferase
MIIKKANSNNIKEIVQLWLDFMNEHDQAIFKNDPRLRAFEAKRKDMGEKYEAFIKSYIGSKNGVVFLASENHSIAGYALVFIKDEIPIYKCKQVGYISDLYVKDGFRSQGLSTKLKNQAIAWLKRKKITCVAVPLYPANKTAHSIYEKWGFFDYKVEMRMKI